MQFTVSKSALSQALSLVGGVIEKRTTIPILSNVKLPAGAETVEITGTDLGLAISVRIPATVAAPGVTTLPGKNLSDYSRLLADGDVTFKTGDTNWTTITTGRAKTRIAGMSAGKFPELPAVPEPILSVPVSALILLINRTRLAITSVESRFTLNGELFSYYDGRLHLVATDGHRLACAWVELPGVQGTKFLLPSSAIRNLGKLSGEAFAISQDENHLFFRAGEALLTVRKLTGNFPDYHGTAYAMKRFVDGVDVSSASSSYVGFNGSNNTFNLSYGTYGLFSSRMVIDEVRLSNIDYSTKPGWIAHEFTLQSQSSAWYTVGSWAP